MASTPVQGRTVYLSNYGNYVPKYLNFTWPKHLFMWFHVFTNKKNFFMKTFNGILKKNYLKHFKKGILYHVSTSPFPFQSVFPFFSVCFEQTIGWNLQDIKGSLNGQQPKQYYHRIWKHTWMCFLVFRIHTCVKSITKECMKTSNIFIKDGRGTRGEGRGACRINLFNWDHCKIWYSLTYH